MPPCSGSVIVRLRRVRPVRLPRFRLLLPLPITAAPVGIAAAAVVVFFAGTLATKEVLKYTKHDPSIVVIDETAGQLFTFVAVADQLTGAADWRAFLLYLFGFGLFRVFDITKPQPARWADSKVLNAWGVMLDDIFAGVYAAVILYVISIYL